MDVKVTTSADHDPVEKLAEEFLERFRRGERPALTEYTERHPDLAEQIRELFPALVVMEQVGPSHDASSDSWRGNVTADGSVLRQLGEYRILREIGRGGMGVVYEAEQESLGRHVALKVLPHHALMDPNQLKRFRREARAAAQLHHTNIVPVFGVGEEKGIHYFAMQFIQGQGLDQVLEEVVRLRGISNPAGKSESGGAGEPAAAQRSMTTITAAQGLLTGHFELAASAVGQGSEGGSPQANGSPGSVSGFVVPPSGGKQPAKAGTTNPCPPVKSATSEWSVAPTASAVSGAHSAASGSSELSMRSGSHDHYFKSVARVGVQVADALAYAHGQGILHRDIKPSNLLLDSRGTVWVTDFGLAKRDAKDDLTHTGDLIGTLRYMAPERFRGWSDPHSDIYGLGLTLYELLTLRPAFEESDRARLIKAVAHDDPPRPTRFNRRIPRDLETVVLKAIAKEPTLRYDSAAQLADDLRRFLDDKPIEARRSTIPERARRWCRRNPVVASLTASIALLVVTLAVGSSISALWLRQERNATVANLDRALRAEEAARGQLQHVERAEAEKTRQLWESLLFEARWWRGSGRAGHRFKSLQALASAVQLAPSLHLGPDAMLEYRNEAIACMTLVDVKVERDWDTVQSGDEGKPHGWAFDSELERYARFDEAGNVSIRRALDHQELIHVPGIGLPVFGLRFSPNG